MRIGVVFPQTEIGQDPAVIRDYAQAVESMGYTHILAFDSVVGANPNRPGGWDSQYTYQHAFHEPFVLFGFCAGVTRRIELVTGIVILPQRQTALVAKQAAAVDVLSGGRLRLGIGVGWNTVEFEALGENFKNRGKRVEEQLEVMRLLWTKELVTYDGQWHALDFDAITVDAADHLISGRLDQPFDYFAIAGPLAQELNQLSLNYLSIAGDEPERAAAALRSMLSLYGPSGDTAWSKQLDGLTALQARQVVRRLPMGGPLTFGTGIEVTASLDDMAFQGSSAFLLGCLLERFFARHVALNTFSETVLRTTTRGEVMRWPARLGDQGLM